MNIFYLSHDIKECAQYHVDKHVVKMILEYSQLLSTAHQILDNGIDIDPILYKATHKNHPSAIWARLNSENYKWLYSLLTELHREYTYRYGRIHKSSELLDALAKLPRNISIGNFTQPTPAMPEQYIQSDSIQAYRDYYRGEKTRMHNWKNREKPQWLN